VERTIFAIATVTAVSLLVAALFVHIQISELQNQIGELQVQNTTLETQLSEIQDQLSESQKQISEQQNDLRDITHELALKRQLGVLIIKFKWVGGFNPIGGLTMSYSVNVTVRNIDVIAVSGLTLTVRLFYKGTLVEVDSYPFSSQIDNLKAGESREITGDILAALGSFSTDSAVCVVRLTMRDVVLDEGTYNLS
jgi:TolA-binding protein